MSSTNKIWFYLTYSFCLKGLSHSVQEIRTMTVKNSKTSLDKNQQWENKSKLDRFSCLLWLSKIPRLLHLYFTFPNRQAVLQNLLLAWCKTNFLLRLCHLCICPSYVPPIILPWYPSDLFQVRNLQQKEMITTELWPRDGRESRGKVSTRD